MRRAAKRDSNEVEIIRLLRLAGCSVQQLSAPGVPDLLVGKNGVNVLLEIKDPAQPPYKRQLTPDQVTWHLRWEGQVAVVETADQSLSIVKLASCGDA